MTTLGVGTIYTSSIVLMYNMLLILSFSCFFVEKGLIGSINILDVINVIDVINDDIFFFFDFFFLGSFDVEEDALPFPEP